MPGSLLTYTVDKSIQHGVKSGVYISIGHSLLELVLVVLLFVGVGKYLAYDTTRTIIGILGGIVLAYLGFQMIKDVYLNKVSLDINENSSRKLDNMFLGGAVISAVNPYFIIWWSAVGLSLIMRSYNRYGLWGLAVFYVGHISADFTWYTFVSTLISKTRHLINENVYKGIVVILALCLIYFSFTFFAEGIKYLT